MRILHLAWEYPPVLYGGLGRHVHALARAQAAAGHDVVVITQAPNAAVPARVPWTVDDPVRVLRVDVDPTTHDPHDLRSHVGHMECDFVGAGAALFEQWQPDVIHAHDWMVAHAAAALREHCGAPLTATIHATEAGRNQGWVSSDLSASIHAIEWWLANTADALIACSSAMRDEVQGLFGVPSAHVVANGIEPGEWQPPPTGADRIRSEHAADPLIVYTGRVEWEKGVQTLLAAMPELRTAFPDITLLVAGRGSYLEDLRWQAQRLGLGESIRFLGWVSEEDLRSIVAAADVAVAPSLYEPFGLIALEAAAVGTPLVVSRCGGLAEFAGDDQLALTFTPGDVADLAGAVARALADPVASRRRANLAHESVVADYSWRDVGAAAVEVYRRAAANLGSGPADPVTALALERRLVPEPHFEYPPGRLLDIAR